jgi:hypothetical protein
VTSTTSCNGCHGGYNCTSGNLAACTVNKTIHINGTFETPTGGDCTGCHNKTNANGRNVVTEFQGTWSHKRSASPTGTVTKYDCVVCHMEGNLTTGDPDPAYHLGVAGQNINLRDPDTGVEILNVTYTQGTGASAGSYANGTGSPAFTVFSRNLGSSTLEGPVQAIMINQCLKCHDSNGAQAAWVRGPTVGSSTKPFATTIAGAAYTGIMTAGGVLGGVTDVRTSFLTTNASYHPILGQQNNSYQASARFKVPWSGGTKTPGTTTSWGWRISCWDCHAPNAATGVQTSTVTAHGGAVTLRQSVWVSSTASTGAVGAGNLCLVCHNAPAGNQHGAGSAWASGGSSTPGAYIDDRCYVCHASSIAKPARPYPAQDVHGYNAFSPAAGADTSWPVGTATNTWRPYGFFRSIGGSGGLWNVAGTSWKPLSGPGVPAGGATCAANDSGVHTNNRSLSTSSISCNSNDHGPYSPGGVY